MAEEMEEMECDIITLVDKDGKDVDFYHVATIDYDDKWFVFLQPVEPMDDIADDEVIIYELGTDENGDDKFIPIESEEYMNEVFNEYLRLVEEDECGCGCDCDDDCECGDCDCGESGCDCNCHDED